MNEGDAQGRPARRPPTTEEAVTAGHRVKERKWRRRETGYVVRASGANIRLSIHN